MKFLSLLLCACLLLVCVSSGVGILFLESMGLYTQTMEELQYEHAENTLYGLANRLAQYYAAQELGKCPPELLNQYYAGGDTSAFLDNGLWFYTLADQKGTVLFSTYMGQTGVTVHSVPVAPYYPTVIYHYTSSLLPDVFPEDTGSDAQPEEPAEPFAYTDGFGFYDADKHIQHTYQLGFRKSGEYVVTLYLLPGAYLDADTAQWRMLDTLMRFRYGLFYVLAAGLLLFGAAVVYLCHISGRQRHTGAVSPVGLSLGPLDLYAAAIGAAGYGTYYLGAYFLSWLTDNSISRTPVIGAVFLAGATCFLTVGGIYAASAQVKLEKGFWVRNMLAVRLARRAARGLEALLGVLPIVWRMLLVFLALAAYFALALILKSGWMVALGALLTAGLAGYLAWCYGALYKTACRMSRGNLTAQLKPDAMVGSFRRFAGNLNALADTAAQEAQRRMQSERMRSELITNVSHDIRTPLTSIINYVDLLHSVPDEETYRSHLAVLDRQSQRLNKLIDDLMELSHAASGTIPMELAQAGAGEAITQALGEFSYKLERAELTPVFQPPEEEIYMVCDGRLTWRVLSNLLNNAVKYAMPGTRLYIDLEKQGEYAAISLTNISRERITASASELMERFVRGDASRNTEGSGLGLNIAKSLMELQHGQFQLALSGDQFKVKLLFPIP